MAADRRNGSYASRRKSSVKSQKQTQVGCFQKVSAVLTRVLFILHATLALWRINELYDDQRYMYGLSVGLGCLVVEMVFTLAIRQGREYKWFCPSVFFYLLSVVPSLWFLQIAQLDYYDRTLLVEGGCMVPVESNDTIFLKVSLPPTQIENLTNVIDLTNNDVTYFSNDLTRKKRDVTEGSGDLVKETKQRKRKRKKKKRRRKFANLTTSFLTASPATYDASTIGITTIMEGMTSSIIATRRGSTQTTKNHPTVTVAPTTDASDHVTTTKRRMTKYPAGNDEEKPSSVDETIRRRLNDFSDAVNNATKTVDELLHRLDPEQWLLALHQVLLFVLVIGRWLLPKGEITRDQLSQLLLVFIGVGADILEFVTETIDNDITQVQCNRLLHYIIYAVWSASLLQFTLVLTAAKSRKTRVGFSDERVAIVQVDNNCCARSIFNDADLWGILVTMLFQDLPFLAFRLYMMIVYNHIHQMIVFFTGKNALVVILQIYRIIVLQIEHKKKKPDSASEAELQPLKGTLEILARNSIAGRSSLPDVSNASFKAKRNGSVVVKIHLENELKAKRKGTI